MSLDIRLESCVHSVHPTDNHSLLRPRELNEPDEQVRPLGHESDGGENQHSSKEVCGTGGQVIDRLDHDLLQLTAGLSHLLQSTSPPLPRPPPPLPKSVSALLFGPDSQVVTQRIKLNDR